MLMALPLTKARKLSRSDSRLNSGITLFARNSRICFGGHSECMLLGLLGSVVCGYSHLLCETFKPRSNTVMLTTAAIVYIKASVAFTASIASEVRRVILVAVRTDITVNAPNTRRSATKGDL